MRITGRSLLCLLALLSGAPLASWAREIRISADGSGDFRRVEEALPRVRPGDTMVLKGSPAEADYWSFRVKDGLRLKGEDGAKAWISFFGVRDVSVSRLVLLGPLTVENSNGVLLRECVVRPAKDRHSFDKTDSFFSNPPLLTVRNSGKVRIERCRLSGGAGAGVLSSGSGLAIRESVIEGHWGGGVAVQPPHSRRRSYIIIDHSTLAGNRNLQPGYDPAFAQNTESGALGWEWDYSRGSGVYVGAYKVVLRDSIVALNDRGILLRPGGRLSGERVLVWGNARGDLDGCKSTGFVMTDPGFVDPKDRDWRPSRTGATANLGAPDEVAGPAFLRQFDPKPTSAPR